MHRKWVGKIQNKLIKGTIFVTFFHCTCINFDIKMSMTHRAIKYF